MKRLKNKNFKDILCCFLIIALFSIPFFWFSDGKYFLGGEAYNIINQKLFLIKGFSLWSDGILGGPNSYIAAQFFHLLNYVLAFVFSNSTIQKIIFGFFLSGSFFTFHNLLIYFFGKEKKWLLVIPALLYVFNPFYIMMFGWAPVYGFLFVFAPVIFKLFASIFLEHKTNRWVWLKLFLAFLFFSPVALNISLFGLLLLIIFLFWTYCVFFTRPQWKVFIKKTIISIIIIIIANSFWLFPIAKSYKSIFGGATVYQTNFYDISLMKSPIIGALTLNGYYWFDKKTAEGIPFYKYASQYQFPSEMILFVMIILSVLGLIFIKNRGKKRAGFSVFFLSLFLIGVFLSKGTAPPFGWLYKECLTNIKACGIYRSSDLKFPYLVIFSLPFLFSYFLIILSKYKRFRIFNFVFLSAFVVYLGWPFIIGSVIDNQYKVKIPNYWYTTAKELESTKTNGRVLLLPKNFSPFDEFSWGYNGAWLTTQLVNRSSVGYTLGYGSSIQEKGFMSVNKVYDYLEKGDTEAFFNSLGDFGIDTIIQRNDLLAEKNVASVSAYGGNLDFYKKENLTPILDSILENKKTIGAVDIYTVPKKYIKPKINSDNATFEKINPTKYIVHIKNLNKDQEIKFLESYDEGWKLFYTKENSSLSLYYDLLNLSNKRAVFGETHKMIYDYANSWTISPEFVKRNLPSRSYHQNSDGSVDIDLIIYFQPQSYFYLGSIITLVSLLSVLIITLFFNKKGKDAKK
ncbi:MAG: alpha-(1-_3)-arabinofuranosyltransferase family protein [Patescibacteria group bacterium]|nr:alpha-(1->3)-arabinofuranosyltransferase family protein [Patescibacteria group bacterium]